MKFLSKKKKKIKKNTKTKARIKETYFLSKLFCGSTTNYFGKMNEDCFSMKLSVTSWKLLTLKLNDDE